MSVCARLDSQDLFNNKTVLQFVDNVSLAFNLKLISNSQTKQHLYVMLYNRTNYTARFPTNQQTNN